MQNRDIHLNTHLLAVTDLSHDPPETLFEQIKDKFILNPWVGAQLYMLGLEEIMLYETIDSRISKISELQSIASIFRELIKASSVNTAVCALNVEAIPPKLGNLGSIFGFHALILIMVSGDTYTYEIIPYEVWDGKPEITESTESAIKDIWEHKLKEPFDDCVKRLFVPINEMGD